MLERLAARPLEKVEATSSERNLHEADRLLRLAGKLADELREEESWGPEERDDAIIADLVARLSEARSEYEALRSRIDESDAHVLALLRGTGSGLGTIRLNDLSAENGAPGCATRGTICCAI